MFAPPLLQKLIVLSDVHKPITYFAQGLIKAFTAAILVEKLQLDDRTCRVGNAVYSLKKR